MKNVYVKLPDDPLAGITIREFGERFRSNAFSCTEITLAYLKRIEVLDKKLKAFVFINKNTTIKEAEKIDRLFKTGNDLGPLMGVPVAIKDICAVEGMPTSNGSIIKSEDLTGPEGSLIKKLKALGCVILGKTHTVEFALGATGINLSKGTPLNPNNLEEHFIPGGSSSGSAVAVASGMAPFAIGTDTGGSVRIPASFCGIVGLKTTKNSWPTDGIFPLSPTLDTPGPLCRSTDDAKVIFETVTETLSNTEEKVNISKLKIGKLSSPFTNELDSEVMNAYENVSQRLIDKGAQVQEINMPEADERINLFPKIVGSEIISSFGESRFLKNVDKMDPITGSRAKIGLNTKGFEYILAKNRLKELNFISKKYFKQNDVLISPTTIMRAIKYKDALPGGIHHERSLLASANTQPVNLMGLCAISIPIQQYCTDFKTKNCLPVGLQIICPPKKEMKLLDITLEIEKCING